MKSLKTLRNFAQIRCTLWSICSTSRLKKAYYLTLLNNPRTHRARNVKNADNVEPVQICLLYSVLERIRFAPKQNSNISTNNA